MKYYSEHYAACLKSYDGKSNHSLYDVSLKENFVDIDESIVNRVRKSMKNHLEQNHDICHSKWATYLNDFQSIDGLEELCSTVVASLERDYFNSHVKIENLHILQNKKNVPMESSWVWHYDDCPREFMKFAIYINDVNESRGPMQIVLDNTGIPPVIESYRNHPDAIKGFPTPVFPKSRVPSSHVESIISSGGRVKSLVGPAGTHFLFTPNMIHRGTTPANHEEPRMAIFMFVRPSLKKIGNHTTSAKAKKLNVNVKKYLLD